MLLAVGRLEPAKDHLMLLEAIRLVRQQVPSVVLLIAGTGSLEEVVAQRITELGCKGCVRLLGERDDIDDLYAAADVFVSSSAWEGMPLSILEAMAAGLPVVATDVGDCAEVIGDGGEVVPSGEPRGLAAALVRGLDPGFRAVRSRAARDRARKEYGIDAWLGRVTRVYERAARVPTP